MLGCFSGEAGVVLVQVGGPWWCTTSDRLRVHEFTDSTSTVEILVPYQISTSRATSIRGGYLEIGAQLAHGSGRVSYQRRVGQSAARSQHSASTTWNTRPYSYHHTLNYYYYYPGGSRTVICTVPVIVDDLKRAAWRQKYGPLRLDDRYRPSTAVCSTNAIGRVSCGQ